MKTRLLLAATLLAFCSAAEGQEVHRWWVEFTDKAGSPYSIGNPSEYLGPRALERRARLGIGIDSLDLPVSPAYTEALRQTGGTLWAVSRWLNGALLYAADSTGMAATLRSLPGVAHTVYYGVGSLDRVDLPNWNDGEQRTPRAYDRPYSPEYYGLAYDNINTLNGIALHRAGYEGQGMLVGVCDGGFSGVETLAAFAALRNEGRLAATRDFVYGGTDVFDIHSHGTRVLSNLAAYLPGLYVATAPKASYILCRTEDSGSESPVEEYLWAAAVEYMDSLGVDVVNTSLGYRVFDDSSLNYPDEALDGQTAPMTRAANAAALRGILVVVAAGNDGYDPGPNIGVPADSPAALTVGAMERDGWRAVFSSFGPTADGRIKPDIMALGQDVWVVNPDGTLEEVRGTSFASPIAAGMATCVAQRYPTLGPAAWCDSIRSWGDRAAQPDDQYGYGTPDFGLALRGNPPAGIGDTPLSANDEPVLRTELYDIAGRRLPTGESVDPSPLPRGIYFLRLVTPSGTRTKKVVKP